MEIQFGPGEEKIAQAFVAIDSLKQVLAALAARVEVDSAITSVLLDQVEDPQAVLQTWQATMAAYYPGRALPYLADPDSRLRHDELKNRIQYWTELLLSRARREG